jgi:hypothetical protein
MASTQKRKASDYPLTPRKRITSESSSDTSTSSQSADTSESELNSDRDDHSAPASPTLTSTSLIQAPSHIISGVAATAPAIDRNNKNEKPIGHDADTKTDNDTVHIKNDDKINERGANVGEPITLEATMRVTTHAVQPAHNGTIVSSFIPFQFICLHLY